MNKALSQEAFDQLRRDAERDMQEFAVERLLATDGEWYCLEHFSTAFDAVAGGNTGAIYQHILDDTIADHPCVLDTVIDGITVQYESNPRLFRIPPCVVCVAEDAKSETHMDEFQSPLGPSTLDPYHPGGY